MFSSTGAANSGEKDSYFIHLVFLVEKESIHLSYADKLNLVAYWKQVSCGKYDESKIAETGYFDVIGNDRRYVCMFSRNECHLVHLS